MTTYDVEIKFVDGTVKTLRGCSGYSIDDKNGVLSVSKNGYNQLFNFNQVVYCGRAFDLNNKGV